MEVGAPHVCFTAPHPRQATLAPPARGSLSQGRQGAGLLGLPPKGPLGRACPAAAAAPDRVQCRGGRPQWRSRRPLACPLERPVGQRVWSPPAGGRGRGGEGGLGREQEPRPPQPLQPPPPLRMCLPPKGPLGRVGAPDRRAASPRPLEGPLLSSPPCTPCTPCPQAAFA